ncbi:hypothetical protein [Chitinophaga qingshengii]|uniref:Uncharacterized protein n=1 Tax=Chitinophaga qingshengii TaxID=1569794 RepID=A0ABR7TFW4_9BACT|nr:hypothetical protein [Chitinophaga qingshengii]MBC9929285.1 hypothetical protein [Chitinophaga qingshengii]
MHVADIIEVKEHLDTLKNQGLVNEWELPYENLLTRRSAAIFFVTPVVGKESAVWSEIGRYNDFSFRLNEERKLSNLQYRITFSSEEKGKN